MAVVTQNINAVIRTGLFDTPPGVTREDTDIPFGVAIANGTATLNATGAGDTAVANVLFDLPRNLCARLKRMNGSIRDTAGGTIGFDTALFQMLYTAEPGGPVFNQFYPITIGDGEVWDGVTHKAIVPGVEDTDGHPIGSMFPSMLNYLEPSQSSEYQLKLRNNTNSNGPFTVNYEALWYLFNVTQTDKAPVHTPTLTIE